ncbi:MAG: metallophosphoesterase [Deltaproteobacteria bacterium]|nr:metallophosphoesterase [Deltaproteobacteria bacterium]
MFISVFLTLYGLLHFYAFLKVQKAFVLSRGAGAVLACFMLFMLFCPVLVRVLERHGVEAFSRILAITGYIWMGFLFLFVCAVLLMDLYGLICRVGTYLLHGRADRWIPSARVVFFAALAVSVTGTAYGYLEALTIRKEHLTIRTPKIPKSLGRLRIVQISDMHLGRIVGEGRLENILGKVREAKPDILVSTGDLVDGQMDDASGLADMLERIHTPYGKFAVTGNHEFYAGLGRSLAFTEAAGFTVLRGTGADIKGMIFIAGVDDAAGRRFGLSTEEREEELLSQAPMDRFALLLKHRPYVAHTGDRNFDLQLSGHTHGGQIFPFSLIIKMLYPVDSGLLRLRKGAYLYVSRGGGTWGPPIRFLAPPEIAIIDLVYGRDTEQTF